MANNKIQVKRTSTSGRTPNTTNSGNSQYIDAGELALNMADGILYTSNGSVLIPVGANNANVNVSTTLSVNGVTTINASGVTSTGNVTGSILVSTQSSGAEGGEIQLAKAQTSTLTGNIFIDIYENRIRFFEQGTSTRGAYIDFTACANGVGTNLLTGGGGGVDVTAQFTWTNTHIFQANVAFTGNNITVASNTGSVMFGGAGDTNWRIGRSTGSTTKFYYTNNTLDILAADSNLEGVAIGKPGGNTYLETGYAGTFTKNPIYVGNSSVNVSINSTSFSGTSNNSVYLGGIGGGSYLRSDVNDQFSGAVLQVYNDTGVLGSTTGTANTLQIFQANTGADAFLTFHVSGDHAFHFGLDGTTNDLFVGGWSLGANKYKVWHQNNDGAGSGLDADLLDGSHASDLNVNSALTSNNSTYAYGKNENALNVNAAVYATNSVNANNADYLDGQDGAYYAANSQLASYALLVGATFTGNVAANNANTTYDLNVGRNLTVAGNLTITGNVTVVGANTLEIVDNFLYLNSNNTTQNEDVGIAANYNDGTYRHTGIFRDASDGFWKVFDSYEPEPDANVNIDTANLSFHIADFWANTFRIGNTSVYSTINTTSFSGTSNNTTYAFGKTEGNLNVNAAATPAFSGDAVTKNDLTTRTESGFYETSSGTTAEGWPLNDTSYQSIIAITHSNDTNYYSTQIGGSFFDQELYFRKTNNLGTTAWTKLMHVNNTLKVYYANGTVAFP